MRLRNRLRHEQRGFSLVELLVVMLLLGVVGAIVMTSIVRSLRTTSAAQDRVAALNELERGIERISRELRAANPLLISTTGDFDEEIGARIERDGQVLLFEYELVPTPSGDQDLQQTVTTYAATAEPGIDPPLISPPPTTSVITQTANATAGLPLIRYYDRDGVEIVCVPGVDGTLDECATRYAAAAQVQITLTKVLEGRDPLIVETYVSVRNTRYDD